jgi:hypothetical protein
MTRLLRPGSLWRWCPEVAGWDARFTVRARSSECAALEGRSLALILSPAKGSDRSPGGSVTLK